MNSKRHLVLILLLAILLSFVQCEHPNGAQDQQINAAIPGPEQRGLARAGFQMAKIFDFQLYKRLFHKAYGHLEEMVRRKYVMARAFRAWTSSIKYKFRLSSFYLALNHLSDRSPEELHLIENERLNDGFEGLADIQEVNNFTSYSLSPEKKTPQSLMDVELTNYTAGVNLDLQAANKVRESHAASNNADYHDANVSSWHDEIDEQQELTWRRVLTDEEIPNADYYNTNILEGWQRYHNGGEHQSSEHQVLPDGVFLDHRDSGCMLPPRDQGACCACYAFTTIAIAEWLYCRQTGKLLAFSEQYPIDCDRSATAHGCDGGNFHDMGNFIHNYGLELLAQYPYRGTQDKCPYDLGVVHSSEMGYVRMKLASGLIVPIKFFEQFLSFSPMYMTISTRNGFHEYGGGVMEGSGCEPKGTHAVVLIGHGRENGREYWLIRNSFGVGWGHEGHYKLAKDSDCIHFWFGLLFGTQDGEKFSFKPEYNARNNQQVVKAHYLKNLHETLTTNDANKSATETGNNLTA